MQIIGFTLEREGLPALAQQQAQLGAVDTLRSFRAITREDAESALREVVGELAAGDVLVVSSLAVLAVGERPLTTVLADLAGQQVHLVAVEQDVDTRRDAGFFPAAVQIEAGVQAARLADARAVISRAAHRHAQTPPKVEFVPVEFTSLVDEARQA